jgi:hypothetical protein
MRDDEAGTRATAIDADRRETTERDLASHIVALRVGHGANCSSIGSVIDSLFASAVIFGAVFAAVCAAMTSEEVRVVTAKPVGEPAARRTDDD